MRVALVGASDVNTEHLAAQEFDCVVAVDAGWRACRQVGVPVDVALGDFDSLGFVPDAPCTFSFRSDKDESDMELALDHALSLGADEVYLYGAFARRLDHTLANLQLAGSFARKGLKILGIGDAFALAVLAAGECGSALSRIAFRGFDPALLSGDYAPFVSVFAQGVSARGVYIEGLKFEVSDFILPVDTSRGLSNEFTGAPASVSLSDGVLLVTFPLGALVHAVY